MTIYKDKRDKNDYRFIALWLFIGNVSNFFIDGFKIDRFGSTSKGNFFMAIGLTMLFLFTIPLLLILFDHHLSRKMIGFFNKNKIIYHISGIICITLLLVYFVYFTIENIYPGN